MKVKYLETNKHRLKQPKFTSKFRLNTQDSKKTTMTVLMFTMFCQLENYCIKCFQIILFN